MTYKFGRRSVNHYETLDPRLQYIMDEAIQYIDFSILCGHRDEAEQNTAFERGNTKLRYPRSKHNSYPSKAVDIAPYPIDWNDTKRFGLLAGYILRIAHEKGINIRWGGDWDSDGETKDNRFNDLPHFELID